MTSIKIPETVKVIERSAFDFCGKLNFITIPKNLENLDFIFNGFVLGWLSVCLIYGGTFSELKKICDLSKCYQLRKTEDGKVQYYRNDRYIIYCSDGMIPEILDEEGFKND